MLLSMLLWQQHHGSSRALLLLLLGTNPLLGTEGCHVVLLLLQLQQLPTLPLLVGRLLCL